MNLSNPITSEAGSNASRVPNTGGVQKQKQLRNRTLRLKYTETINREKTMGHEANYVIKDDAPYVVSLDQKQPTGTLPAGTRCVLINDGDMGGMVRTERGIEGWVAWDKLEKIDS
jgi:hypothetical protein